MHKVNPHNFISFIIYYDVTLVFRGERFFYRHALTPYFIRGSDDFCCAGISARLYRYTSIVVLIQSVQYHVLTQVIYNDKISINVLQNTMKVV